MGKAKGEREGCYRPLSTQSGGTGKMREDCAKPVPRLPVILPKVLNNVPEKTHIRQEKEKREPGTWKRIPIRNQLFPGGFGANPIWATVVILGSGPGKELFLLSHLLSSLGNSCIPATGYVNQCLVNGVIFWRSYVGEGIPGGAFQEEETP